jgi:hypothetical protein
MIYGWVAFGALFLWHIVSELLNRKERDRTLNRLMAKNFQEFNYFDKKYDTDLKEVELLRDEERQEREIKAEEKEQGLPDDKALETFVKGFEEEWGEDINRAKLKEAMAKE